MRVNAQAPVAEFCGTDAQTTHAFGVTALGARSGRGLNFSREVTALTDRRCLRAGTEVSVNRVFRPGRRAESSWSGACWERRHPIEAVLGPVLW
jgi:hypothetical protein